MREQSLGEDPDALAGLANRDTPGRAPGSEDLGNDGGNAFGRYAVHFVTLHDAHRRIERGPIDVVFA